MLSETFKQYKWPIIALTVLLVGLIGYSLYISTTRAGKEPVEVYAVPSDTTITANGQPISRGTAYLLPGTYTIEAKRGGFADYKDTITVTESNKQVIDIALEGVSESALQWVKDNQKLYLEREGRGGTRAQEKGELFTQANPITSKLPYRNILYTIGYKLDPSDPNEMSITLEIDAGPGYRQGALQKIRDLGYDPTDFKINFKNYESPF